MIELCNVKVGIFLCQEISTFFILFNIFHDFSFGGHRFLQTSAILMDTYL